MSTVCKECRRALTPEAPFCQWCGAQQLEPEKLPPCVEVSSKRGIYRITFAPVEGEFDNEDSARHAAYHSGWNEGHEFDSFELAFVRSTVPPNEYPYCCSCGDGVSDTTDARCGWCGKQDWKCR